MEIAVLLRMRKMTTLTSNITVAKTGKIIRTSLNFRAVLPAFGMYMQPFAKHVACSVVFVRLCVWHGEPCKNS